MKKYLVALLALLASAGCRAASVTPAPFDPVTTANAETVAFVLDYDGYVRPFCSGVWVDAEWILTANHCTLTDDEPDVLDSYIVHEGEKLWHPGHAVYRDAVHDIALVHADSAGLPAHAVAKLANHSPRVGAPVHVVGHPLGMWWTYLTGQVAGYRSKMNGPGWEDAPEGPLVQLQVPIWHGNSGGGAFDGDGGLIGIACFVTSLPEQGFFVSLPPIRHLMTQGHLL